MYGSDFVARLAQAGRAAETIGNIETQRSIIANRGPELEAARAARYGRLEAQALPESQPAPQRVVDAGLPSAAINSL